jgi:hypothetical protein
MHLLRPVSTTAALLAVASLSRGECPDPLLSLDGSGEIIAGSKQALIDHVDGGGSVRVGWQLDWNTDGEVDVSHWSSAELLSVAGGEVFAQFPAIHRQIPLPGRPGNNPPAGARGQSWSGMLGTDGVLEGKFAEGGTRRWSVASRWCANEPAATGPTTSSQATSSTAMPVCIPVWTEQFRNSAQGDADRGTLAALLGALRRGDELRVTWGGTYAEGAYSVEHVAEPVFFSIVGGEHVVAQLPEHVAQTTYLRLDGAAFGDQPGVMWRGLLRTDGMFDAVWVDRSTGQVVRRLPQRAAVSWLTLSPPAACDTRPPLQLAVPGGVVPDVERASERVPP